MDGWITIGTKLDTTKFDQEVSNLESKIDSAEKKQELINQKTSQHKEELKQVSNEIDGLSQEYEKASMEADRLMQIVKTKGIKSYEGFQANLEYEEQVKKVDELFVKLSKLETKQQSLTNKVAQNNLQYENSVKQVDTLRGKLQQLNAKQVQDQFKDINASLKNFQKNLTSSISKVGKIALGVFSIYSAYRLLSSASGTLAQYDEQYATNLEYIRFALTQGIAPILKYLVNLAGQLLGYLNYILTAWFGINLFSDATAEAFKKMSAGASSTANSAKEIKKQLAGFDEMTVLGDSNVGTLGGSGGATQIPSFDVSEIQGDVPDWLDFIVKNKNEIISGLLGIVTAVKFFSMGLGVLKSLGIGLVLSGIVYSIMELKDYLESPTFKNLGGFIQGIGVALLGLATIIGGIPLAVSGAVVLIFGTIVKYWDNIKAFFQRGIDWLTDKSDSVHKMFGDTIGNIYDTVVSKLQDILDFADDFFQTFKWSFDQLVKFFQTGFAGDWDKAWDDLTNTVQNCFSLAGIAIDNLWNKLTDFAGNIGSKVGNVISNTFRSVINSILSRIESILNSPIRAVNKLIGTVNSLPGVNMGYLSTFSLPRLKSGGIINLPNQGINIGGAIAGEAGAEGVIPLTDSQAMETLGQTIGKYITINANITNSMNGRVISRQLKKIQGTSDFAYNR